ncbi:tRNA (adenosine(37)-N6)-threonylcarbamoyltransferase complex ATPase subunit type 1 TsaE [Sporosarcina luteola]|uniref:tRNA (adenosine(37)-N6)-threonylcarbamoyltransferase complex ATPase subunit type 1 TsaE n=1 Tax=Sporosarcina luteola TaxID=582850 RepID=UPI0020423E93|nr:tRNA (adenosine(37)-N6)-threonylcarbamoyltransferase complex ATPase subunit type 1 TsaE [Sporosarcina luteola]MCM3711912.1 tRNA (adenosine(37)-N6)-threonylcarbamoyltransferase complex ATPase subunit type 1 TsaE [Sporosarcina luteola]
MTIEFNVHSLEETEHIANRLAGLLSPPDVVTLEGDLGAGKTTFTKALARSLGITRTVNSPTFTILKQYEGNVPFNHLDVYRLADSDEDLGWDELFYGDAVSVVEWAHLIEADLPEERLEIRIQHTGETSRKIVFIPKGERFEKICEAMTL